MPEFVEEDGLELSLLVARAARSRDKHLALLLKLFNRRSDLGPRFSEALDGESTSRSVASHEREQVRFRGEVKVRLGAEGGQWAQSRR